MSHRPTRGQATVELALLLPLVVLLLMFVVQVVVLARDRVGLVHATREAARAAATATDLAAAGATARAAHRSATVRVVGGDERGLQLAVEVREVLATDVPVIGRFLPDLMVREEVSVRAEW